MKKIGVVSFYYYNFNYGGLLQACALTKSIKKLGFDAEQVCVRKDPKRKRKIRPFIKLPGKIRRVLVEKYYGRKMQKRNKRFAEFMDMIPHSEASYTWKTIKATENMYDGFICGSDQIWNPNYARDNDAIPYMLSFVDDKSKLKASYAASVGVSVLTETQRLNLNESVKNFNAISLREESAKKFFDKDISGKVQTVLDPTLLLNASEWEELENYVETPGRYIFCYFLGESRENRKYAKKLSKELNAPIVISPYINLGSGMADIGFGDIKIMDAGPKEFLYLIHHAELVVTDSFHACVFSMQFKRPFLALSRDVTSDKGSMHSRLYDFAEKFHLQNQLMLGEKRPFDPACMKIDWAPAYEVLAKERENSMEFLRNALSEIND